MVSYSHETCRQSLTSPCIILGIGEDGQDSNGSTRESCSRRDRMDKRMTFDASIRALPPDVPLSLCGVRGQISHCAPY